MNTLLLNKISKYIEDETGLYFPESRHADFARGLKAAAQEFKFSDDKEFIEWIISSRVSKKQLEVITGYLTIGETYFFRDDQLFRILKSDIFPELIRQRQHNKYLRIWSAGCSSGEEPYSIAILLHQLIPDINKWHITLLATDINTESLKKCVKGVYSEWSFRNVPSDIKRNYFKKHDGYYEIVPFIKKMVEPFYLNLSKDIYPSMVNNTNAIDMIFCRNVLMYFSPQAIDTVTKRFFECLVDEGCLITSPSDFIEDHADGFKLKNCHGVFIYKKNIAEFNESKIDILETSPGDQTNVNPDSKNIDYENLAKNYSSQGMLDKALMCCELAIAHDKSKPELHYLQAMILLELGKIEECIQALNRVLILNPDFVLAYIVLGNIYHQQNSLIKSKKYFSKALDILNNFDQELVLPESGDITAGRLKEFVQSITDMES